jgi:mRNA interferase HigB
MRVISLKPLQKFWERYPDAERPLRQWYKTAAHADWKSLQDVRCDYPHADGVRTMITHQEYSAGKWKD